MIFPEEKRQLIKFLDKHSEELHWPDWVIAVIRQLIEESDAAEKRIREFTDRQVETINRIDEMITGYKLKLQEAGWTLNRTANGFDLAPATCRKKHLTNSSNAGCEHEKTDTNSFSFPRLAFGALPRTV